MDMSSTTSIINPSIMMMLDDNNILHEDYDHDDMTTKMMSVVMVNDVDVEDSSTRSSNNSTTTWATATAAAGATTSTINNNNITREGMKDNNNSLSTTTTTIDDKRKHSNRFFAKHHHHAKWNLVGGGRWIRRNDDEDNDEDTTHTSLTTFNKSSKDTIDNGSCLGKCSLPPTRRRAVINNRVNGDNNIINNINAAAVTCRSHSSGNGSPIVVIDKQRLSRSSNGYYETPSLNAVMMKDMMKSSPNKLVRYRWWTGDFEACPPYLGEENHPLHDMRYSPFIENDRQWMRILRKAPKFNNSDRRGSGYYRNNRRRSSIASRRSSLSSAGGSLSDCEVDEGCARLDEVMDSLCCQSDPESSTRYEHDKVNNDGDQRIRRSSLHRNRNRLSSHKAML